MNKRVAFAAVLLLGATAAGVSFGQDHSDCRERPRGLIPLTFGWRADAAAQGYNGRDERSGYAGPEVYGYWRDYGWFGPQYGAWYGPGGYTYYSRTGDYSAAFLPPPSMRGPPPGSELYPPPY